MKRKPSEAREVSCQVCSKAFMTRHSQGKYCSPECRREGERKSWREYGYRNLEDRRNYHKEHYIKNREREIPRTVMEALRMISRFKKPRRILVKPEGQFHQISAYQF